MSKISLAPDASGTGIFTIASPNSNTNRTLTLPDDTGTIVTNSGNQAGSFTTLNTSGAVVFNDAGADVDFRVEGDTNANLLFVDAGNDRVGIGVATPQNKFQIDDGGVSATGVLRLNNPANAGDNFGVQLLFSNVGSGPTYHSMASITAIRTNTAANYNSDLLFATQASSGASLTERARITSGGDLLLGTTTNLYGATRLQSTSASSAGSFTFQGTAGNAGYEVGQIWKTNTSGDNKFLAWITEGGAGTERGSVSYNRAGNLVSYNTSSDYRLKEKIIDLTDALETVARLQPRQFTWKETGNTTTGFIAHELAEVLPHAVTGTKDEVRIKQVEVSAAAPATYDENGNELTPAVEAIYEEHEVPVYQGVDTSFLVATLTAAIQELSAKNDALEARIAALETGV
jgi:hypothetical protein